MAPWVVSPNKSDNYIGDDDAWKAKVYRALTGRKDTAQQLDNAGFRAFSFHRAYTVRQMNELNMRKKNTTSIRTGFSQIRRIVLHLRKGTIRMDKDDIERTLIFSFRNG